MPNEQFTRRQKTKDTQYRELLFRILNEGVKVDSHQGEPAFRVVGHMMRFNLSNGFPIITERDLCSSKDGIHSIFYQALGELFAFLHGAHTQKQLESFGCLWWKRWVTEEKCAKRGLESGDLGPGSYGPAWTAFPTAEGSSFNQITHLIEQIKELPHLSTHYVSPWIPQYIGRGKGKQQKVVVAPCHGWIHVLTDQKKRLTLFHSQRSADVPVGLVANLIQYAALTMMIAQVTGYIPHELVYCISNAHIFEMQIKAVEEMLMTSPSILPTVTIDPGVTSLLDFRQNHFKVSNYNPRLPSHIIRTPV